MQTDDGVLRLQGTLSGRVGGSPALTARFDLDGHVYGSGALVFAERLVLEGSARVDEHVLRCRLEGTRLDIALSDDSAWGAGIVCGTVLGLPESFWLSIDGRGALRAFDSGQLDGLGGGDVAAGWAPNGGPLSVELGASVIRRESTEREARRTDVSPWAAVRLSTEHVGGQLTYALVGRLFDSERRSGWEHVGRIELWGMPLPWLGLYGELELGQAEGGSLALAYSRLQVVAGARLALDWQESTTVEEPTLVEEDGWVELRFRLPGAREVAVVGSFNDWEPARGVLQRESGDVFAGRFRLDPGRHEYHLLVDGEPVAPPDAARYVSDDFGGRNAVLEVGARP